MPNVLAVDLGRQCGFALAGSDYLRGWRPRTALEGPRASNAGLHYGPWKLGIEGGLVEYWYAELWRRLTETHYLSPLNLLAYESGGTMNFKSKKALMSVVGLGVVCMTWGRVHEVETVLVENGALKKHAAGHGWSEKDAIDLAARRLGWQPHDNNVADALFVLDLALTRCQRS